ncbi:MAG TPA: YfbK domain-containing protein, partial [Vicinamibacterales bacterium]|nr:YfbK domain-containing protein [Vicinamibacterales bacterium]
NLVFLLDVSGSMMPWNRLPLIKSAMRMLTDTLRPQDRVAIVVYAGASGLALPSTPGSRKAGIENAIETLTARGSANGAAGIELAYAVAQENFVEGGVNRVILATDGDLNVGVTSQGDLLRLIEEKRRSGVFLSVLGVGDDNPKDSTMEKLADAGNGNYSYLDSLQEAGRVLVAEAGATLVTVAKDVKLQVEFNPAAAGAYWLVGYEDRLLRNEDFNDDRNDAGVDMGAGHTVTALYEVAPPGEDTGVPPPDPLKYPHDRRADPGSASELMTITVRYTTSDGEASRELSRIVPNRDSTSASNLGFAAAVAEFGLLLRHSRYAAQASWVDAVRLARLNKGEDRDGYRGEFIRLAELAREVERQSASGAR